MRRIHRSDSSQNAIVEGLRAIPGVTVEIIGRPVDLAVRRSHWPPAVFKLLEAKSHKRVRKDQGKQIAFIEEHGISRVTTLDEAIEAMGE